MTKFTFILLFIFIHLLYTINANSQTQAITEYGDTIYIYNNGSWSFEQLEEIPEVNEFDFLSDELKIDTINTDFTTSSSAKKHVKSSRNQFRIQYDNKLWKRVPPASFNNEAEFSFQSKNSDIWCVVISEETPIEPESLFRIAKHTIKERTGSEAKIIKTELRRVNGQELIRGVLSANISGISFIFDTYYFSNDKGAVQFTTWTSKTLWEKHENSITEFLNGFIVE